MCASKTGALKRLHPVTKSPCAAGNQHTSGSNTLAVGPAVFTCHGQRLPRVSHAPIASGDDRVEVDVRVDVVASPHDAHGVVAVVLVRVAHHLAYELKPPPVLVILLHIESGHTCGIEALFSEGTRGLRPWSDILGTWRESGPAASPAVRAQAKAACMHTRMHAPMHA